MADREKVITGLECCSVKQSCSECPWMGLDCNDRLHLAALELLKQPEDTSYQRLMEINRDLIERNTKLSEEAQELARFNDNLTKLCEALMKKVYADEKKE